MFPRANDKEDAEKQGKCVTSITVLGTTGDYATVVETNILAELHDYV